MDNGTQRKSEDATPTHKARTLSVFAREGETEAETIARYSMEPSVQAAMTMRHWSSNPLTGASLDALVKNLSDQCALSNKGDLGRSEAILTAQIATLNQIFNSLAGTASLNLAKNYKVADTILRLAFKAQSQCRCAIEALAEVKNPRPVAFVRQANISAGPQQVNHFETNTRACARENNLIPNELLKETNGERLEPRAESGTVRSDTEVETMGAIDRPENI